MSVADVVVNVVWLAQSSFVQGCELDIHYHRAILSYRGFSQKLVQLATHFLASVS